MIRYLALVEILELRRAVTERWDGATRIRDLGALAFNLPITDELCWVRLVCLLVNTNRSYGLVSARPPASPSLWQPERQSGTAFQLGPCIDS